MTRARQRGDVLLGVGVSSHIGITVIGCAHVGSNERIRSVRTLAGRKDGRQSLKVRGGSYTAVRCRSNVDMKTVTRTLTRKSVSVNSSIIVASDAPRLQQCLGRRPMRRVQ